MSQDKGFRGSSMFFGRSSSGRTRQRFHKICSPLRVAQTMTAFLLLSTSQCQRTHAAMSSTSQMIASSLKTFQRRPISISITPAAADSRLHHQSTAFASRSGSSSLTPPSQHSKKEGRKSSLLDNFPESTITRIKMLAPKSEAAFLSNPQTFQKLRSKTRTNSRFLRTFPPLELYKFKRPGSSSKNSFDEDDQEDQRKIFLGNPNKIRARLENGNSPVFYIRLPPAPYVYVPGIGYVSPHPYSNGPQLGGGSMPGMSLGFPAGPVMMTAGAPMLGGSSGFMLPSMDQDISTEQPSQNVISLPLKFLSNGRPHQIESPKKRPPKNPDNSAENQVAAVISGGKYSFNGRPTAVFVVRSPADHEIMDGSHHGPDLGEMTMILPQK